jgi:hypothetical protein
MRRALRWIVIACCGCGANTSQPPTHLPSQHPPSVSRRCTSGASCGPDEICRLPSLGGVDHPADVGSCGEIPPACRTAPSCACIAAADAGGSAGQWTPTSESTCERAEMSCELRERTWQCACVKCP